MQSFDEIEHQLTNVMYHWVTSKPPDSYTSVLYWIPEIHAAHRHILRLEEYIKIHGPNALLGDVQLFFVDMCEDVLRYVRDCDLTDIYVRFLVFTENGVTTKGSLSHQ